MIPLSEAQALVWQKTPPLPPEMLPLTTAALGLVLAETVVSDLDMPPFDKALMDGFAVRSADLAEGPVVLTVIEEVCAGQVPGQPMGPGQAVGVMTGAPLPTGGDAVVKKEECRELEGGRVDIQAGPIKPGLNVLHRGREMTKGQAVLAEGTVLRPQEFGVLASVGRTAVRVHPAPGVTILATGDELVEASEVPGPGQIRNSNGPMLLAQACRAGAVPFFLGVAPDQPESLRERIGEGLAAPILVLSGGVSVGKHDLTPGVLQELGVTTCFHGVALKPGKPVFFGTRGSTLVFGLPGNPVSAFVCFELFVRPAIRRLRGLKDPGFRLVPVELAEDLAYRSERPVFHPAWLEKATVRPVAWLGSADLKALTQANAFIFLPGGQQRRQAGQRVEVLRVEGE